MSNIKTGSMLYSKKEKIITQSLIVATLALLGFTTFSLFATSHAYATGDTVTRTAQQIVNVNLLPSIGISVLDSTATNTITDLAVNIVPTSTGAFNKNSAVAQVQTTNRTGYTLYISSDYQNHAGTDTASLINTTTTIDDTTTSSVGNIPTLSASDVSETDFSAANSTYKNMWGYSKVWSETVAGYSYAGGSATTYQPVPVSGNQVAIRSDVTRQISTSNTTVGVGVNVDTTKAAGTYKNKLVFTAIANSTSTSFTLNFNANGGSDAPSSMTATSSALTYNFSYPATDPTYNGHTFLGWAGSSSATTPDYQSGDTIPVSAEGNATTATRTVYAVWE